VRWLFRCVVLIESLPHRPSQLRSITVTPFVGAGVKPVSP